MLKMALKLKNYGKFKYQKLPLDQDVIILGKCCSGKKQLLSAYIIYFQSINLICGDLDSGKGINYGFNSLRSDLMKLLTPNNKDIDWNCYIRGQKSLGKKILASLCGNIDGNENIINLHAGGSIGFYPIKIENTQIMNFAHMYNTYHFTYEKHIGGFLTSFEQTIRMNFCNLEFKFTEIIKEILLELFPSIKNIIKTEERKIIIISINYDSEEESGCEDSVEDYVEDFIKDSPDIRGEIGIEITACSCSIQKIFAAFILLFSLIQNNQQSLLRKYYLIDQPEAILDKQTSICFVRKLKLYSKEYGVNLIATTTQKCIARIFEEEEILLL